MSNENMNEETPQENEGIEASEEVTEELSEIERLHNENAQLKDKYARVHADFDNIKKRLEREKYQAVDYANEKFARDLIPVIDALDMAISATKNADLATEELLEKLKEGIELTMKQFLTTLEKHGVTAVSHEEEFDPNIHNAVQKVDSDEHESGAIVQTFQTGYRYKDRPLRDAMVIVAN
ncbi:nucleotide exchange factor GrpE [Sulfurimonas sp. HSL-1716]|uniref:nucleotide exchange factor GrpE n=1 Tax=Hydrocurvibacter sulfurireducens TaxID=3131937 RepID=UPI0031F7D97C